MNQVKNLTPNHVSNKDIKFVKTNKDLARCTIFNANEKYLISSILSWQAENKQCFQSSEILSIENGINIRTVERILNRFSKLNWFESKLNKSQNEYGFWINKRILVIDEQILQETINKNLAEIKEKQIVQVINDTAVTPEAITSLKVTYIQPLALTVDVINEVNNEVNTSLPGDSIQPLALISNEANDDNIFNEMFNDYNDNDDVEIMKPRPILPVPAELLASTPIIFEDGSRFELINDIIDLPGLDVESVKTVNNDSYFQQILDKNLDAIMAYKKEKRATIFTCFVDDLNLGLPSAGFQHYMQNIEPFAKDWYSRNEPIAA